jgi:hypothetical protein
MGSKRRTLNTKRGSGRNPANHRIDRTDASYVKRSPTQKGEKNDDYYPRIENIAGSEYCHRRDVVDE